MRFSHHCPDTPCNTKRGCIGERDTSQCRTIDLINLNHSTRSKVRYENVDPAALAST